MTVDLGFNRELELAGRLGIALVLGALIGFEREFHRQPAGFRTHALVALGSALFTIISAYGFAGSPVDPTRIAAQIVSGIGTHHGGAIFFPIVQRDFNLPRLGDYMVIGENVSIFIDDEPRALPLLRYQSVEKIKSHRAGSDVHHGIDILVIDADVVLLFDVAWIASAGGFGNLHFVGTADPVHWPQPGGAIRREIENNRGYKKGSERLHGANTFRAVHKKRTAAGSILLCLVRR